MPAYNNRVRTTIHPTLLIQRGAFPYLEWDITLHPIQHMYWVESRDCSHRRAPPSSWLTHHAIQSPSPPNWIQIQYTVDGTNYCALPVITNPTGGPVTVYNVLLGIYNYFSSPLPHRHQITSNIHAGAVERYHRSRSVGATEVFNPRYCLADAFLAGKTKFLGLFSSNPTQDNSPFFMHIGYGDPVNMTNLNISNTPWNANSTRMPVTQPPPPSVELVVELEPHSNRSLLRSNNIMNQIISSSDITSTSTSTLSSWDGTSTLSSWDATSTLTSWDATSTLSSWDATSTLSSWDATSTLSSWDETSSESSSSSQTSYSSTSNEHHNHHNIHPDVRIFPMPWIRPTSHSPDHRRRRRSSDDMNRSPAPERRRWPRSGSYHRGNSPSPERERDHSPDHRRRRRSFDDMNRSPAPERERRSSRSRLPSPSHRSWDFRRMSRSHSPERSTSPNEDHNRHRSVSPDNRGRPRTQRYLRSEVPSPPSFSRPPIYVQPSDTSNSPLQQPQFWNGINQRLFNVGLHQESLPVVAVSSEPAFDPPLPRDTRLQVLLRVPNSDIFRCNRIFNGRGGITVADILQELLKCHWGEGNRVAIIRAITPSWVRGTRQRNAEVVIDLELRGNRYERT